mmetsp:Transcript_1152/g.2763  ORF Transcript_1152/g.2763 Transcript_1152/m.2763 type:complete len:210 (-) Transcript_1152:882-1511(-)
MLPGFSFFFLSSFFCSLLLSFLLLASFGFFAKSSFFLFFASIVFTSFLLSTFTSFLFLAFTSSFCFLFTCLAFLVFTFCSFALLLFLLLTVAPLLVLVSFDFLTVTLFLLIFHTLKPSDLVYLRLTHSFKFCSLFFFTFLDHVCIGVASAATGSSHGLKLLATSFLLDLGCRLDDLLAHMDCLSLVCSESLELLLPLSFNLVLLESCCR